MANDNAVRNQKVFVTLQSILELQQRYVVAKDLVAQLDYTEAQVVRKRALREIIELLQLPMMQ